MIRQYHSRARPLLMIVEVAAMNAKRNDGLNRRRFLQAGLAATAAAVGVHGSMDAAEANPSAHANQSYSFADRAP